MKSFTVLLTVISAMASAAPVVKSGQINTGYDRELNAVLTKKIQVSLNKTGISEMLIEGEDIGEATLEDGKIFAYVTKPKKYFFYSLNLNPTTQKYNDQNLIVIGRNSTGSNLSYTTSYCSEGANALLSAYVGDGTKKDFCVTIK
tara:strand:+ start:17098 stop:17532 length:435 start_codon:yes stop_codon:yes gene_type:complete